VTIREGETVHETEAETVEGAIAELRDEGLIKPARNADGSVKRREGQIVWVSSDWGKEASALEIAANRR